MLAYQGDPETGEPWTGVPDHQHHVWDVDRVGKLIADQNAPLTFFCGGSRNFPAFIDMFDGVFVLDVDAGTRNRRLDRRPGDEPGSEPAERELILRLHRTKEDSPPGIVIDATAPLTDVVDEILRLSGQNLEADRLAPRSCRQQDLAGLIGLLAVLEGEIWAGEVSPHLRSRIARRMARAALVGPGPTERELRQAISDLNQRLRYALGEYDEPPSPWSVPE